MQRHYDGAVTEHESQTSRIQSEKPNWNPRCLLHAPVFIGSFAIQNVRNWKTSCIKHSYLKGTCSVQSFSFLKENGLLWLRILIKDQTAWFSLKFSAWFLSLQGMRLLQYGQRWKLSSSSTEIRLCTRIFPHDSCQSQSSWRPKARRATYAVCGNSLLLFSEYEINSMHTACVCAS